MSDCFDHEMDAWDSYDQDEGGYDSGGYHKSRGRCNTFVPNPLYYYTHVPILGIEHSTDKAILIKIHKNVPTFWVPRALCKHLENTSVYIQSKFFDQMLAKYQTILEE